MSEISGGYPGERYVIRPSSEDQKKSPELSPEAAKREELKQWTEEVKSILIENIKSSLITDPMYLSLMADVAKAMPADAPQFILGGHLEHMISTNVDELKKGLTRIDHIMEMIISDQPVETIQAEQKKFHEDLIQRRAEHSEKSKHEEMQYDEWRREQDREKMKEGRRQYEEYKKKYPS